MNAEEFNRVLKMKRELEELADKHGADVSLNEEGDAFLITAKDRSKTGPFGGLYDTVEEARAFLQGLTAGKRVEHYQATK